MSSSLAASKKTIAMFYPLFAGGGAETVALWMMEALKHDYDITLFSITSVDLSRLDRLYGTKLAQSKIIVRSFFPAWLERIAELLFVNVDFFRNFFLHLFLRWFKKNTHDFDVLMSGYNAVDFGRPGIQYIHWKDVFNQPSFFWLSEFSNDRLNTNLSLSNSGYTAVVNEKEFGIQSRVVYPPVTVEVEPVPWAERENAVICSGRLTSAKQPHMAIRVVEKLRSQGFDLKLYLTGGGGGTYQWKYRRFLQKMVEERSDWVTVFENLNYRDYMNLMARCRYGLHLKPEPFGISIAEMMKLGLIPFVRTQGGQSEIVGDRYPEARFERTGHAADCMATILGNPELHEEVRQYFWNRRHLFSTADFMAAIQQATVDFLALHPNTHREQRPVKK